MQINKKNIMAVIRYLTKKYKSDGGVDNYGNAYWENSMFYLTISGSGEISIQGRSYLKR